jgi:hypothetical protein
MKSIEWDVLSTERKNFNSSIIYLAKLSFKIDGGIKVFQDKQKLKQYYDHQTTTTEDSERNPIYRGWKYTYPWKDGKY